MYLPLITNYDPVLRNWLNKLSFSPSNPICKDLQELILGLRNDGNLTELDLFHTIGGLETDEQRLTPLISTANTAFTTVNSPTLDSNGVTGNGSSSYINTLWNPASNGMRYSLNSASMGLYSRTNSTVGTSVDFGCKGSATSRSQIFSKYSANGQFYLNTSSFKDVAMSDSLGLISIDRTGASTGGVYKNGTLLDSNTVSSLAIPDAVWFIGALNNNGTPANYSARNIAFCYAGGGLINQNALYNRVQTYMTRRGINV